MAHYDCSNCGESMGIAFGMCTSCTPPSIKKLEIKYNAAYANAEAAWNQKIAEITERLERAREIFISQEVQKARIDFLEEWNKHAPDHLREEVK